MSEQTRSKLTTELCVTITTVAPVDVPITRDVRDCIALELSADLFDDESFMAWLTADEARQLAGQLVAQADALRARGLAAPSQTDETL